MHLPLVCWSILLHYVFLHTSMLYNCWINLTCIEPTYNIWSVISNSSFCCLCVKTSLGAATFAREPFATGIFATDPFTRGIFTTELFGHLYTLTTGIFATGTLSPPNSLATYTLWPPEFSPPIPFRHRNISPPIHFRHRNQSTV